MNEQFGSVQGLVDAKREYQRMAPQKLKDETLKSILGPCRAPAEIKETPNDGSVQALLQKLLHAEAPVAERKWRNNGQKPKSGKDSERFPCKPLDQHDDEKEVKDGHRRSTGPAEMVTKCYKC